VLTPLGVPIANPPIPFASNHCFLHRDTVHFNDTAVNPEDVREHYDARAGETGSSSRCMVMPPGSSWDDETGFQIRAFIASNVAVVFTAGLSIGVGDDKAVFFGGNPVADAGFRYYFF